MQMTDGAMKTRADGYWATHRPVGTSAKTSQGGPAAEFTVANFLFDNGGAGQVDTARILVGESVMWQWVVGFHTITSGTGAADPNAGALFNQPSDTGNRQFTFVFNAAGTYPFFCSFHELQNMKGVVEVSAPAGVGPAPGGAGLGFTASPAPNPTGSGVTFRYALHTAGRVRAEVFDANGRLVARIMDRDQPAGEFSALWDGRGLGGAVRAGVYYVRLRLPGLDDSRRVVIRR